MTHSQPRPFFMAPAELSAFKDASSMGFSGTPGTATASRRRAEPRGDSAIYDACILQDRGKYIPSVGCHLVLYGC